MTPEFERAVADQKWWMDFGDRFGWALHSWTYRLTAAFIYKGIYFQITADIKASIEAALKQKEKNDRT